MTRPVIALLFGVGFGALATAVILQKNKKNNCNTDIQTGGNIEEEQEEEQEEDEIEEDKQQEEEEKDKDKPKKREDKLCSKLEDNEEKNACNSFYFILLNRNKNNSKKDIATSSFIAKKVFLEELEKKKEMDKCRSIAIWRAERYLQNKLQSGGSGL